LSRKSGQGQGIVSGSKEQKRSKKKELKEEISQLANWGS